MGVVSKEAVEREQRFYELRVREVEALAQIAEYLKPVTVYSVDLEKLRKKGWIK